nr:uncharacterized protein LOC105319483 isoform X2 [Crassostrea gigas]
MKFVWLWTVLWNILPLSLTAQKYITINVNDIDGLAITCSIINSDQLAEKHLIQLQRKKNNMFETVISINRIGILWKDEVFKKRATANGSLEEGELRLFIDKVQCFTDFTEYRCYMEGILNPTSTQKNLPEINDTVTWSYSDTCTSSTAQKYISINVTGKDDLAITCSIINSDQLGGFNLIQLKRENGTTFDIVISMLNNGTILWKDKVLEKRATANGTSAEAELRLFIPRSGVQCFIDFTKYKCTMEGPRGVPDETEPKTASNIDTCTSTSKPQTTTTKKPETTQRPGNAVTSTPQPRTTRASGNIGNADKDKRSSGTTLHISITGVETSQYTALLNALFLIPVWIIVKLNTDSA